MMKFSVEPKFLTSVQVKFSQDDITESRRVDHPSFAAVRDRLETLKYIVTERRGWNMDYVIKEFNFNDHNYYVGETFLSAGAIGNAGKRL